MPRASAPRRPRRAHADRRGGHVAAGARLPTEPGITLRGGGGEAAGSHRLMAEDRMTWSLVVHGGAKEIPAEQGEANRRGCRDAIAAGRVILERAGTAVQAVEAAIRVLE